MEGQGIEGQGMGMKSAWNPSSSTSSPLSPHFLTDKSFDQQIF